MNTKPRVTLGRALNTVWIVLLLPVSLAALVGLFYAIEDWRGNHAWQRYLAESAARGEKNNLVDFISPPVSNSVNFAKTPLLECAAYKGNAAPEITARIQAAAGLIDWEAMGDFRRAKWTCFDPTRDGSADPTSSASGEGAQRVLADFREFKPEIDELRRAANRPCSRFDVDGGGFEGRLPDLVFLRMLTQIFSYHALAELAAGNAEAAFDDIKVIEKIADGLRGQPTLALSMIRCAILGGPDKQPFYEGWARGQWSEHQYQQFQESFATADLLQNVDASLRGGERAGVRDLVLGHTPRELENMFKFPFGDENDPSIGVRLTRAFFIHMPRGWWQQNLVVHHRILDHLLSTVYDASQLRVFPEASEQAGEYVERETAAAHPFHFIAATTIPNIGRALKTAAGIEIVNHQAMLACALERYRSRHGAYPVSLNDLVPAIVSAVPKDPTSGQIPFYQRQTDGTFLLSSQGWSHPFEGRTDQRGDPKADDYVWPFPRKP